MKASLIPGSKGVAQGPLVTAPSHSAGSLRSSYTHSRSLSYQNGDSGDHISISNHVGPQRALTRQETPPSDKGYRLKVKKTLLRINGWLETATPNNPKSGFKRKAYQFPEVPAEGYRNPALRQTSEQYNHNREVEYALSNLSRQNSQAGSFTGSVASEFGGEGSSAPRTGSSRNPRPHRSTSPAPERGRRGSIETTHTTSSGQGNHSSIPDDSGTLGQRPRKDTLEVPKPTIAIHHSHTQNS